MSILKNYHFFYKATGVISELKSTVEKEYNKSIEMETIDNLRCILEICRNIDKKIYTQYGFLAVLRDYYDGLEYFEKEDWEFALNTIMYCISDEANSIGKKEYRNQWQEKMEFYNLIGNHFAIDASQKIINSLI